MARAFICLARNDLTHSLLQSLDLWPYTSQRSLIYDPPGQSGYLEYMVQDDVVATTADKAGVRTTDAAYDGLKAYIVDNVNDVAGGNVAWADGDATTAVGLILTRVNAGQDLTLAEINTILAGISAGSTLDGAGGTLSTGTVAGLLQILSGEQYHLAAGAAISGAADAFLATPAGYFTTAPNVAPTLLHPGGRNGTDPAVLSSTPTQTPPQDVGHRAIRQTQDTGHLQISAGEGRFFELKQTTFDHFNETYTYGAAGTALTINGTNIGVNHQAAGVVIYAADGTVI